MRALDSLARKRLITTRQGGGRVASAHRLNFATTTALPSGVTVTPHAQTTLDLQAPEWCHCDTTSTDHKRPSISIESDSILDRVLTARPQHFQTSELDLVRRMAYKWLTLQRGGGKNPPAPDAQVCARIAASAGSPYRAEAWIRDHLEDRGAETCEYLVVWMLQIIHGCAPPTVKRRRAELRLVKAGQPAPEPPIPHPPTPDADPQFAADLVRAATAGAKKLR